MPSCQAIRLDGQLGSYPVRFLDTIARLSKCLKLKRERVNALKDLVSLPSCLSKLQLSYIAFVPVTYTQNALGERRKSFGEHINEDFQRKYAATVLDLSQINRDLNEHLKSVREFTQEFSGGDGGESAAGPTISLPNMVRESCQEDAYDLVNRINSAPAPMAAEAAASAAAGQNVSIYFLLFFSFLTSLFLLLAGRRGGGCGLRGENGIRGKPQDPCPDLLPDCAYAAGQAAGRRRWSGQGRLRRHGRRRRRRGPGSCRTAGTFVVESKHFVFCGCFTVSQSFKQALQDSIREIKLNIRQENVSRFENCVEAHLQHIQAGLSQMGSLRAFFAAGQQQQQQQQPVVVPKTERNYD